MAKILVVGDTHLDESLIDPEISPLCDEILSYSADVFIHLGDLLEKHPTQREIFFATKFASELKNKYKEVYFLTGNHPTVSSDFTNIDYLKYLGIKTSPDLTLDINKEKWFFGHFFTDEALPFTDAKAQNLSDYYKQGIERVILGHYHDYLEIDKKSFFLGAMRYCSFAETQEKRILIIDSETGELKFIPLKNVIPSITVDSITELINQSPKSKVRLKVTSFEQLVKESSDITKLENKNLFVQFKVIYEFSKTNQNNIELVKSTSEVTKSEFIKKYLENIKNKEVRAELEIEFAKEGFL